MLETEMGILSQRASSLAMLGSLGLIPEATGEFQSRGQISFY